MKHSAFKYTRLLILLLVGYSCAREQADLVLNENYLHVADVLQYCQGTCDEILDWEMEGIKLKGFITEADDEATMLEYYQKGKFYLHDIRNGMFLEIRIEGDKDIIFQVLSGIHKQDEVYLDGVAESVIVNEGNECMKGVVIVIDDPQSIRINP